MNKNASFGERNNELNFGKSNGRELFEMHLHASVENGWSGDHECNR